MSVEIGFDMWLGSTQVIDSWWMTKIYLGFRGLLKSSDTCSNKPELLRT